MKNIRFFQMLHLRLNPLYRVSKENKSDNSQCERSWFCNYNIHTCNYKINYLTNSNSHVVTKAGRYWSILVACRSVNI